MSKLYGHLFNTLIAIHDPYKGNLFTLTNFAQRKNAFETTNTGRERGLNLPSHTHTPTPTRIQALNINLPYLHLPILWSFCNSTFRFLHVILNLIAAMQWLLFKVYFNMKRRNADTTSTFRNPLMHLA